MVLNFTILVLTFNYGIFVSNREYVLFISIFRDNVNLLINNEC